MAVQQGLTYPEIFTGPTSKIMHVEENFAWLVLITFACPSANQLGVPIRIYCYWTINML